MTLPWSPEVQHDVYIVSVFVLLLIAGIMSGLTLSVFSIDIGYLKTLATGGSPTERSRANRLLMILANEHWLLVTLLLCNAAAVESLPLALHELMHPAQAIALSSISVLICSEIIPQAIFVKNAIAIGAFFAYPVRLLMFLLAPLSFTLGALLDYILGHRETTFFRRAELREFLNQQNEYDPDEPQSPFDAARLSPDELKLMHGALSLSEKTVKDAMQVKLHDAVMISEDAPLNHATVERIIAMGYSRIPVYRGERSNIQGYLIVKTLFRFMYKQVPEGVTIASLSLCRAGETSLAVPLCEVYKMFHVGSQLAVVLDEERERVVGIMTQEDVLEAIHSTQFYDERDLAALGRETQQPEVAVVALERIGSEARIESRSSNQPWGADGRTSRQSTALKQQPTTPLLDKKKTNASLSSASPPSSVSTRATSPPSLQSAPVSLRTPLIPKQK